MFKRYRDTNYEVNECGVVMNRTTNKVVNGRLTKSGYLIIKLGRGGKSVFIHTMVADTFIRPVTEGLQVHHINHIKTDNRVENLEVLTIDEHKMKHNYLKPVIALNKDTLVYENEYGSIRDAEIERGLIPRKSHISSAIQNKTRHKSCDNAIWYYKQDRYHLWKMILKAKVFEKFKSII